MILWGERMRIVDNESVNVLKIPLGFFASNRNYQVGEATQTGNLIFTNYNSGSGDIRTSLRHMK